MLNWCLDCKRCADDWQHTMHGPLFLFAFVIATLLGATCHLIFGGAARRLAIFLMSAWVGFALGQAAGRSFGIELWAIGELRIVSAVIGAVFALFAALIFTSDRRRSSR